VTELLPATVQNSSLLINPFTFIIIVKAHCRVSKKAGEAGAGSAPMEFRGGYGRGKPAQ
jgi:hypothetical protein